MVKDAEILFTQLILNLRSGLCPLEAVGTPDKIRTTLGVNMAVRKPVAFGQDGAGTEPGAFNIQVQ